MKVAHLILEHKNPKQLERLISRLAYHDDAIYIHLDKKADFAAFSYLSIWPNVYWVHNRVQVTWGAYSIVEATINGFQEIINSGIDYQYINLLSGADYPLQTPETIHRFLESHNGQAFMSYLRFDDEWPKSLPRIHEYHFTNYTFPARYTIQKAVNRILPKRVLPDGLVAVGRSQWFTVPAECIKYILNYWQANAQLRRFIRFTWGPDEFIFQTILYNSVYRDCMVNDNLRYINWAEGAASPMVLTLADKDALLASNKLFARKFDMQNHPQIMDVIDQKLTSVTI